MFAKLWCAVTALIALSPVAQAAEPGGTPIPRPVLALAGCWAGRGEVMGKLVTMSISARPIVQDAMLALDAESKAIADPHDRYSAHLIFGGAARLPGTTADRITGFWADSFGGAYAASGQGETRADGFDITYSYSDAAFVNRWRLTGAHLAWQIVARDSRGVEKPFATYALRKAACSPLKAAR